MSQPPDDDPPSDGSRDDGTPRDDDSPPADDSPLTDDTPPGGSASEDTDGRRPPDASIDGDGARSAGFDDDSPGQPSRGVDDPQTQDRSERRPGEKAPGHSSDGTQSRPTGGARRSADTAEGAAGRGRSSRRPASDAGHAEGESNWVWTFFVDVASSALAVLLVGFFLFTVSGVWPPMVAVESGSMTPNMQTGDLVFVMDDDRFPGDGAHADTGVVTAREGADSGYSTFGDAGDVIVYEPDGNGEETPIIHRAMFWVEKGERWHDEADENAVGGANSCADLSNCPAPHAGFITKGDANSAYDQVEPQPHSGPVKPAWIVGTAEVRVPKLGCVRLPAERCGDVLSTSVLGDRALAPRALDAAVVDPQWIDRLAGEPTNGTL